MEDINNAIIETIKSGLPKNISDRVTENSRLREDLSLNSVNLVQMALKISERIEINLMDADYIDDFSDIKTVGDIIRIVEKIRSKAS